MQSKVIGLKDRGEIIYRKNYKPKKYEGTSLAVVWVEREQPVTQA